MALTDYKEETLTTLHPATLIDLLELKGQWKDLGCKEEEPDFKEAFEVTANKMSAKLTWNEESQILAGDNLDNPPLKDRASTDGPRSHMSELLEEFCRRRMLRPKIFAITNCVEEDTWAALGHIKTDGLTQENEDGFKAIMATPLGKIAGKLGNVKAIWALELALADGTVIPRNDGKFRAGPTLLFLYTEPKNLKRGCFMARK